MNNQSNSWDKQESESNRAYNAFLTYRDMGALRSLRKAAEIFYGIISVSKVNTFLRWSANNNWVARCGDWDAEEERIRIEQKRKDIREMDIRQAKAGMKLSQIGMTNIELHASYKPPKDEGGNIIKPKIPVPESTRLFTEGIKAERIARGVVTEITEHKGGIKIIIEDAEPETDEGNKN